MSKEKVEHIKRAITGQSAEEALSYLATLYSSTGLVFSTSFGYEDQVISHLIFSKNLPVKVFTLDTGRLFPETYAVWSRTLEIYRRKIEVFSPDTEAVEKHISAKGPNGFYESVDNRLECCHIRKVEPLQRALRGNVVWITGIRKEQSANRNNLSAVEWDEKNNILKFHPLFDWNFDEVKEFIKENNVPYNALHDRGFPSIGCQPCTRAVREGEDVRAGRWWWEEANKKECGLHAK